MFSSTAGASFGPGSRGIGSTWGWFVALGLGLLLLGFVALGNLAIATLASVLIVGAMMMVGGILQIIVAFRIRKERGFLLWLVSGLLYAAAGVLTFYNPRLAAQVLTLLLAFALILSGFIRIAAGVRLRPYEGWGWIVASGVVSTAVGAIVIFGWPFTPLFTLGIVLAVDLAFQGVMAIAFGLLLRHARHHVRA